MNIYLLPGLGFDDRIFSRLDLNGLNVQAINWIEPLSREALSDYAKRMAADIPSEEAPVLIGHSMGGMVAQEIAALRPVQAIILLSSIRSRRELPRHFRIVQPLGLQRLFWKGPTIRTVQYWGKAHGYESEEELTLFKNMVGGYSNHYLQWALRALSIWEAPALPVSTAVYQIHGSKDKTFPAKHIESAEVMIDGGSHLLLYKRPQTVNELVRGFLRELDNRAVGQEVPRED